MLTGLIPDQQDLFLGENSGHLGEIKVHHLGIDPWEKKRKGITCNRRNA
jgi:hypothetical protein